MNAAAENTFNEAMYENLKSSLSTEDYEAFINFKKREKEMDEYKAQQRRDQRKKDAGQEFFTRKDALILRRVKAQGRENEFCTEDEALSCVDIHKMRKQAKMDANDYTQGKTRIEVPDEEIAAFLRLEEEGHFYKDITLEMVDEKVAEIKAAEKKDADSEDTGGSAEGVADPEESTTEDEAADEDSVKESERSAA